MTRRSFLRSKITITDAEIVELIKNAPDDGVVMLGPLVDPYLIECFFQYWEHGPTLPQPDHILDAEE